MSLTSQGTPGKVIAQNSSYIRSATGGDTVQMINGYMIHTFTTVGTTTFTPATSGLVDVLIVAGGGGGGGCTSNQSGGGGGAGELIYRERVSVSGTTTVTIGTGGNGGVGSTNSDGTNGSNSVFGALTALGGGFGGTRNRAGNSGGSGGGSGRSNVGGASTAATGFGNAGGLSVGNISGTASGGGGGGATSSGQNAYDNNIKTPGGSGYATRMSGTSVVYAAGGAGGSRSFTSNGANATANTGNGGGGGDGNAVTNGGTGGTGIVIVRYPINLLITGTSLFTQLSPSAVASSVGAFSLRAINGTSVRAVQIRRSSDSVTQDFYADRLGNLLTAPVTGQPLASWLGSATGYVTTWYDQSGIGNHMSCSSTGIQPKIDGTNGWIDFKPSAYFDTSANPSAGPVPWDSTKNYTVVCHHNTIGNTFGGICETFSTDLQSCNEFYKSGGIYDSYWLNTDIDQNGGSYSVGNRVTFKWDGTNRYIYTNGSIQNTQFETQLWVQNNSGTQRIGYNSFFNESMNGEMYSIFMFNTSLSDADRTLVENSS